MNISENINWIMNDISLWKMCRNKSYRARIQKSNPDKEYNVEGKKGIVYNYLEDSFEKVGDDGFVITGVAGELWPVSSGALKKYNIEESEITEEPVEVDTVELDTVYAAVQVPADTEFTLEVDYGEKAVLKGNRNGIEHGEGDYIIIMTKNLNGVSVPDFNDSGRIVNGKIFDQLYRMI